jgi:Ca2+/Na+ antiporter
MKNAIISGLFIGVLSGAWMFIMHAMGFSPQSSRLEPIEYVSVLIPLIVLYFGVRSYRTNECEGRMGFLEALIHSFKILIVGGIITVAAAIIFIDEFAKESSLMDFSGRIFGALLVGILFSLGVSVLLTTKPNKVD